MTSLTSYPRYTYPPGVTGGLAASALIGLRRSFRRDALALAARIHPPVCVQGSENIPEGGRYLLTVNHYSRSGFRAWWFAAAVSAAVPGEMHWLMTAGWNFEGRRQAAMLRRISRWVFRRVAGTYGFTLMPAMPPLPEESTERALAVRRLMQRVRREPMCILGLAPEGRDFPGGKLGQPPPGTGRLMLALARENFLVFPAGAWEQDGALHLNFGPAYLLEMTNGQAKQELDRRIADTVMAHIAVLLPKEYRGEYDPDR